MKTSITLSLLPNSPQRPFVLGPDPAVAFRLAAELGYDAIEIFPPSLEALQAADLPRWSTEFGIPISTVGTGGGAVTQGLTLTDADPEIRRRAVDYIRGVIESAADWQASAIIGSMQGRAGGRGRDDVLMMLGDSLVQLGEVAEKCGTRIFLEPLNRYESDLLNSLDDAAGLLTQIGSRSLGILADLFHMNIEERSPIDALSRCHEWVGHVHFVDSNRSVAGLGHLDLPAIYETLLRQGYAGYLAVEAFPLPTPEAAASQAIRAFRELGQRFETSSSSKGSD